VAGLLSLLSETPKDQARAMKKHLQYWGAVYFLVLLAIAFNGVHAYYEVQHTISEAEMHHQVYSSTDSWNAWLQTTAENMQSELWQIGLFQGVMLLAWKHRWFKADAEDMERLEEKVDGLHKKMDSELRYWKWVSGKPIGKEDV
jgi:hypothetical protein